MMQAPDGWPVLPDVSANDPQAEVKKARYQAILQAEVGKRQLALDETRANLQFQLDQAKARLQLDLDKSKAAAAARIAEAAARLQLQLDKQKALDQAEIDARKAETAADNDREKTEVTADNTLYQSVHQAYLDVAKGTIDRTRGSADFVQKASTGIGTLYTGVLAFTYGIKEGLRLPPRGFLPAVFFALAIFFSTAYLAFITKPGDSPADPTSPLRRVNQQNRLNGFITWMLASALSRAFLLRAGVLSLGAAVLFLPAAYLDVKDDDAAIGAAITFVLLAILSALIR